MQSNTTITKLNNNKINWEVDKQKQRDNEYITEEGEKQHIQPWRWRVYALKTDTY